MSSSCSAADHEASIFMGRSAGARTGDFSLLRQRHLLLLRSRSALGKQIRRHLSRASGCFTGGANPDHTEINDIKPNIQKTKIYLEQFGAAHVLMDGAVNGGAMTSYIDHKSQTTHQHPISIHMAHLPLGLNK